MMRSRNVLSVWCCAFLFLSSPRIYAEIDVLASFTLGEGGGITYAAAPEELHDGSGREYVLQRSGDPKFFASSPFTERSGQAGSIRFNGETDWYQMNRAIGNASDNFVLEAWVCAMENERPGLHGVVSNGDGARGYTLAQQDDRWVAFIGGVGAFPMAAVHKEQWTHLAMVADGDRCTLYVNGAEIGTFARSGGLSDSFTIGDMGRGNEAFAGDIHHVRFSTFRTGAFDPKADFLLDYATLERQQEQVQHIHDRLMSDLIRPREGVEIVDRLQDRPYDGDWLIHPPRQKVTLQVQPSGDAASVMLRLANGLVTRTFYISSNLACVGLNLLSNQAEFLRAVKPEARIQLNGQWYDIGGLKGQPELSYLLNDWLPELRNDPDAFYLAGMDVQSPHLRYPWNPKYNALPTDWPPKGLHVVFTYNPPLSSPSGLQAIEIAVHYEMYEGLPVVAKWLTLQNRSDRPVVVDRIECEILAVNQDQIDRLHVESDYSFALVNCHPEGSALLHFQDDPKPYQAGRGTTLWTVDPDYDTWATHNPAEDLFLKFPHRCLMVSRPPFGPSRHVEVGEEFSSFMTFELVQDSDDRERKTLAHRRFYKKLAPQATENLLTASITSLEEAPLKAFIDQLAELQFERLNIDPWPGISYDNLDPDYIAHWKTIAEYAAERGIVLGGYELIIASRGRGADVDCIDPATGKPGSLFGQSVCIASTWSDEYFKNVFQFMDRTGFMCFTPDGPYHGDICASTEHAHHHSLEDSQWRQWEIMVEVIHEMQRRNYFIPMPDWYFLNGQGTTGMGYREASANLSPQRQLLLGRQYIYDGTWHKLPVMGGISLQLVGFYTSDSRVGLEPLSENLDRYERGLMQLLGSGAQPMIRGNRLYDTPETKAAVKKWIDWYKKYRPILTSEIIHVGRPTGRGLDCLFHVNPETEPKGLAIVFNPTERSITQSIHLPLYYTGLDRTARVSEREGSAVEYTLDRSFAIDVPVTLEPDGYTWFLVQ